MFKPGLDRMTKRLHLFRGKIPFQNTGISILDSQTSISLSGFPTASASQKVGFLPSRPRRQAGKSSFFLPDRVGKLESRVSSFPTASASWKVGFLPSRPRRQAGKSCIFFPSRAAEPDADLFHIGRYRKSKNKSERGEIFRPKEKLFSLVICFLNRATHLLKAFLF